jgi:tetraacyldisaccharide 4'-kinase
VPVLSIGNLATGGRGKTPVAALVARLLVEAGERPAILSRGYRRRRPDEGVVIVSDGERLRADLDRSGDEPLMLARMIPGAAVLVGEIRAMSAAVAERDLGVTVHVLDDGFQHTTIARDVDIVIVNPADLEARAFPLGRLRSPVSALAAAAAVVFDAVEPTARDEARVRAVAPHAHVFVLRRAIADPVALEPERPRPTMTGPAVAVAGIARPERFTDALRASGWDIARALTFRDHHRYNRRDIERIAAVVEETGARFVLTTAKDAVRMLPFRPLPVPVAVVPLDVRLEPAEAFRTWLLAKVGEARA